MVLVGHFLGMAVIFLCIVAMHDLQYISAGSVSMISDTTNVGDSDNILSSIFDNVSNSIVQVVSVIPPLFNLNPQAQNTTEVGAGFIYDDAGHIVTGNHVLAGANNASVVFKDGDRYNATVVGRDAFTDTAVIKIIANNNTAPPETNIFFDPVTLGTKDR
jgi:S1-C subfamily serine protease